MDKVGKEKNKKIFLRNIIISVLQAHKWLILIVGAYFLSFLALGRLFDFDIDVLYIIFQYVIVFSILFISTYIVYFMVILHPDKPLTYIYERIKSAGIERFLSFFLVLFLISTQMLSFRYIKSFIPAFNDFCWDKTFASWDRIIHGGDPWRIIHTYLSGALPTFIMVVFYAWYFYIIFTVVAWQAARPMTDNLRNKFLLSFVLCWLFLGNVAATIFSSAGPCFYNNISPEAGKYAGLMSFLNKPNTSVGFMFNIQNNLWKIYQNKEYGHLFSISAMPSMHVSISYLLVLVSQRWFTKLLAWISVIITSLACVYLGWHYAIDVYVAILGTWLIWKLVGLYLR
jgi:hypothetical protein